VLTLRQTAMYAGYFAIVPVNICQAQILDWSRAQREVDSKIQTRF
jgi:hypothetical protein